MRILFKEDPPSLSMLCTPLDELHTQIDWGRSHTTAIHDMRPLDDVVNNLLTVYY